MITPILADAVHDFWEIASFKVAVFGAIAAALWAVWQWRRDYRWKQAELARTLLDEIFDYKPSDVAWRIVDGETTFKIKKKETEITMDDVRRALRVARNDAGEEALLEDANEERRRKDEYVRRCFDALFYYLERLEQSCEIKVVRFDDLLASASYYINLMAKNDELFEKYAEFIQLGRAVAFMKRFPQWPAPKS